ncbi:tripartite tricarboxylate transporter TctB family protein [Vibrio diabolicus]|uniref:Tripartite tricarboxylate transporter TctB family protein n=1 Tax=Vibrio diabolicus TaxID=50719 RepID=A0AA92R5J6_9VIBR|nr:tripartite tricarboxylate transporter TctB family protein [Vibrio diabolicus]QRG81515.1 tripartite tricarboxylate transporter TctB family protein [Vibrio diabolicus]
MLNRITKDLSSGITLFILALCGHYYVSTQPVLFPEQFDQNFFPTLILNFILFLSLLLIGSSLRSTRKHPVELKIAAKIKVATFFFALTAYVLVFLNFGFYLPSIVALLVFQYFFARRLHLSNVAVSVMVPSIFYLLFTHIFGVMLP